MAGDVAAIRDLVISAIDALSGWTPSRFAPEFFGKDTDNLSHHSFAVAVTSTEPLPNQTQSLAYGTNVFSTVEVQWAHRLRGDAQSADYDAGCDAEQDIVKACVGISSQHVLLQRLTRTAKAEGWIMGTATFRVQHRYSLA